MSIGQFDPCVELSVSGNCPLQIEGKIAELPFYFRARHKRWSFDIASKPDGDPAGAEGDELAFTMSGPYGHSHEAGWMPTWDALQIVAACIRQYVTEKRLKDTEKEKAGA